VHASTVSGEIQFGWPPTSRNRHHIDAASWEAAYRANAVRMVSIVMAPTAIPDRSSPPTSSVAIASKFWR